MKVDIITRHAIANYGSILQSYASQKIFEKLGYEAEIINYIPFEEKTENLIKTYIKNSNFWNKNFLTRVTYSVLQKRNIYKMNIRFDEFRKKMLNLTKTEYNNYEQLANNPPKADLYCSGSDQLWGKIGNQAYDKSYFLDFVSNESKCISYASSFGTKEISKELDKNINSLLKKYKGILVREKSAYDYLINKGFSNTKQVLDPTMLLDREEWEKLCVKNIEKKPYILIYQLHHNKNFNKFVKKIRKKLGIRIIRINTSKYFKFKPGKLVCLPSPNEFLTYIKNAELVLTDSFHGTVFSILFNKNFVDILPSITGTRINSILELFNLENRIINNYDRTEVAKEQINYNSINKKLDSERKKTIKKLKEIL